MTDFHLIFHCESDLDAFADNCLFVKKYSNFGHLKGCSLFQDNSIFSPRHTYLLIGKTISWKTCLVKVMARITGVVVNFMKAGLGGSIHPSKARKRGWLPNGIIDYNVVEKKSGFVDININLPMLIGLPPRPKRWLCCVEASSLS